MRKLSIIGLTVALVVAVLTPVLSVQADIGNWVIDGDKVYIDDGNVYLSATPHTLVGSGWIEFELISKRYEGEIDVIWGFDTNAGAEPKNPQIWADNVPHEKERWIEVERSGESTFDNIISYEALEIGSVEPNIGNENNTYLVRIIGFMGGMEDYEYSLVIAYNTYTQHSETSATFFYNYTNSEKEYYIDYYPDFKPFSVSNFTSFTYSYLGVDDWNFVKLDATVQKDTSYKLRIWVDIPFSGLEEFTSKYVWGVKPHNESVLEAKASGHLYLLDPWLSGGWKHRIKLTIDNTDIDDTLENFPVLVYLSTSSGRNSDDVSFIFDELTEDANRKKIAITTSDGETQCYVEIEKWDDVNEKAWLWVKVPSIASNADTELYLYYDSTHADNNACVGDTNSTPAENVWDEHFMLVTHMRDDPDASHIRDSTDNNNDGDKLAVNEPIEAAGQIDKAQNFDGNDDFINCGNDTSLEITGEISIEMWLYPTALSANEAIVTKVTGATQDINLYYYNAGGYIIYVIDGVWCLRLAKTELTLNDWNHLVFTVKDGTTDNHAYVNGVDKATNQGAPTMTTGTSNLYLGSYIGAGEFFTGLIDEGRISNIVRTVEWAKASYESGIDDLLAFGSEELTLPDAPTNLTIVQTGTNDITITWTTGTYATTTVIRAKEDGYPTSLTDGYEIYNGALETVDDSGLNLGTSTYYYKAWGHNDSGYSTDYAEDNIGGENMVFLGILGITAIMSFVAFRSAFFGLKLMAGMMWFVVFIYLLTNPPAGIEAGTGLQVALMAVAIGFGLMIVLTGLGRGIKRSQDQSGALSASSEGFKFKTPSFLKNQNSPEARRQKTEESNEEYREKLHKALHPPRRKR